MTTSMPRLELSFPAAPASARTARAAVADAIAELGIEETVADDVRLCVSEAVTNAVRHAYASESGTVDVTVVDHDPGVVVVVRDFGSGLMGGYRNGAAGFGLALIDAMTDACAVSSVSGAGTEVSMAFGTTLETSRRARRSPPSWGVSPLARAGTLREAERTTTLKQMRLGRRHRRCPSYRH
jgi:anti-sigma regulatory factor (Ser/Thr protein kinase)